MEPDEETTPNKPTAFVAVGRLMVSPLMVWPKPSKFPVKLLVEFPTGVKPAPEFQPLVALASMLPPSA